MLNEVFLLQERKGGSKGDRQRETGREDGKNVESHRPLCTALFENLRLNSASFSSSCLLCLDFGSTFCIQFRDARSLRPQLRCSLCV